MSIYLRDTVASIMLAVAIASSHLAISSAAWFGIATACARTAAMTGICSLGKRLAAAASTSRLHR